LLVLFFHKSKDRASAKPAKVKDEKNVRLNSHKWTTVRLNSPVFKKYFTGIHEPDRGGRLSREAVRGCAPLPPERARPLARQRQNTQAMDFFPSPQTRLSRVEFSLNFGVWILKFPQPRFSAF
jgi:hypothetical protein